MVVTIGLTLINSAPTLHAQKQNLKFEHLSIEQGLSQNSVNCLLQDRQGFMWIGTNDGLNKFDGYHFTHYKNHLGDPSSISNNTINSIYEDRSGTLWIGTNGGLNQFNRQSETFRHFRYDPKNPHSLSDNRVYSIFESRQGRDETLWIGTFNGLNKFDRPAGTFTRYQHRSGDSTLPEREMVTTMAEYMGEKSGVLFVGTWGAGLFRFDRDAGTFTRCYADHIDARLQTRGWISSIHIDHSGNLWVSGDLLMADGCLFKYDPQKGMLHLVYRPSPEMLSPDEYSNRVQVIQQDKFGQFLLGKMGEGGFVILDRELKNALNFKHDTNDPNSIGGGWINTIFEDRAGEIWLGTMTGGISKFDPARKKFVSYQHETQSGNSLSDNNVTAIIETTSGSVWIATRTKGINIFDRKSKTFTHYRQDPHNPHGPNTDAIRSLYQDSAGRIWIGTWGGGLNCFDPPSGRVQHYLNDPNDPHSLIQNFVGSICESREGELWIGTPAGVAVMRLDELRTGRFKRYLHDPNDSTSLSHPRADVIFQDRSGQIWIGTEGGGLNLFSRQSDSFIHYKHDPYNANSLSSNKVLSIFQDSRDNLWIGTWGGGPDQFDPATKTFIHYTEAEGLPNAEINGMVEDANANLWISTNNGLSKFNPAKRSFKNYDVHDGLPGYHFNPNALCKSSLNGEIFLGGRNGFTVFHPDSIRDNPYVPPVAIVSLKRHNLKNEQQTVIEEKGISTRSEIELSYKDNILTFEFAALNFRSPEKNQHAYKLEGFNDKWIQLGTKREVTFTNLDQEKYILRVKGSNNDGVWNEKGASLKLIITPPWWKTWWAYTFFALLAVATLYGIRRYELNRIHWKNRVKIGRLEADKLRELDQMKSRFFANISHEFRTPLTLILGQIDSVLSTTAEEKTKSKLQMAFRNARRLLRLINQLLDLSKLEAGSMELNAVRGNLIPFLKNLVFSFESLAEQKHITLRFQTTTEKIEIYFEPDKLEKVFYNLLSNAFKFTPEGGEVSVAVGRSSGSQKDFGLGIADFRMKQQDQSAPQAGFSTIRNPQSDILGDRKNDQRKKQLSIEKQYVEITIRDTGIGISVDKLPHIFDRFYQVDSSHIGEHEGTGIGLALAKELVELHRGEISVTSTEGVGTEFIVKLPLTAPQPVRSDRLSVISDQSRDTIDAKIDDRESRIAVQVSNIPYGHSQSKRSGDSDLSGHPVEAQRRPRLGGATDNEQPIILIVEDNSDIRAYLRENLEESYQVIEAVNGEQGAAKGTETIPDLVITDVMMPKMDGYQLCRFLRSDERTSHIPIIMLTAKASAESKIEGLETGVDDYLTKPFSPKELLARVRNLISLRRQLRERFSRATVIKPSEVAVTSVDQAFLQRVLASIEAHLGDEQFNVEMLAEEVHMSVSQLNRKLHALIAQPAGQLIRSMRLQRAADLLKQNAGTVAEIAYQIGFGSQAHFTTMFQKQFGCTPSEYRKGHRA